MGLIRFFQTWFDGLFEVKRKNRGHMVFVYGSLKRGEFNHRRFGMDRQEFVGTGTISGYGLYDLGAYPCVVKHPDQNLTVHGELFHVADSTFKELCYIETGAGYSRATERVRLSGKRWAWATVFYQQQVPTAYRTTFLPRGIWSRVNQKEARSI